MTIYPAIDIRGGKVVRLRQGDYDAETVYADDPLQIAAGFAEQGAEYLHVVDLDGAKDGTAANFSVISKITAHSGMKVQVGGGIRNIGRAQLYIEAGVSRIIIGTAAVSDPEFLSCALNRYGERVAVGVDASNGFVAVHGWRTATGIESMDFCLGLRDSGVETVIYTDISRDGMLAGPNFEVYAQLTKIENLSVIASGGVSSLEDIRRLKNTGVTGVIIGKALYTAAVGLQAALEIACL